MDSNFEYLSNSKTYEFFVGIKLGLDYMFLLHF